MKSPALRLLAGLVAGAASFLPGVSFAQTPAPASAPAAAPTAAPAASALEQDVAALVGSIKAQLQAGKKTEADLADAIKGFDALIAKHKGADANALSSILMMKAMLYLQVLDDDATAAKIVKQVKADYPTSEIAAQADTILAQLAGQAAARETQRALAVGKTFPDFAEKDLDGKPLSIGALKGKVVLIDFWATWCGPCINELPNVIAAYEKHHAAGFEIIGISLDKDEAKLKTFLKEKNMTWAQYFDGKGWETKLSRQYGISGIPATYLLDQDGKIVATDLRGDDLDRELTRLLAKK